MEIIERPSPNYDTRTVESITMLVFHYTGMTSADAALARMCDPAAKVSAHYLIDEDGELFRMVEEEHRAWHAGISYWRGITDVNGCSIGIELANPGHEFGYRLFPESQMKSLEELSLKILDRHPISPSDIVGHSDIAPDRKMDPGELFDWRRLADRGIGIWPKILGRPEDEMPPLLEMLGHLGYNLDDEKSAITAFQRRYQSEKIDGKGDIITRNLAHSLISS